MLVLVEGDMKKLRSKIPIAFPGSEVGCPDIEEIVILHEESEEDFIALLDKGEEKPLELNRHSRGKADDPDEGSSGGN